METKKRTRAASIAALVVSVGVGVLAGLGLMDTEMATMIAGGLGFAAISMITKKTVEKAVKKRKEKGNGQGPALAVLVLGIGLLLSPQPAMAELPQLSLWDSFNIGFQEWKIGYKDYVAFGIRRDPDSLLGVDLEPTSFDLVGLSCDTPWLQDRVAFLCAGNELASISD